MKFSVLFCLLVLALFCRLNFTVAAQETDRSPFALEFPELNTGKMTEAKNYIARTDVNTIKFWVLDPAAHTIDWIKIKARINRQSANVICSQNPATNGKVLKCDLNRIAGFRLHSKDNLFEIEAVSRDGKPFYASFRVFTDINVATKKTPENNNSAAKPAPAAMSFSGRKFAVVIGVSEYKFNDIGLGNLDFPDDDAAAFKKWLEEKGDFNPQSILYLTNKDATLAAVRDSLNRFLTRATANDLVVFFLAGHGTPDPFEPRESELYFLVHDSKIGDLKNTGFRMTELKQIVDTKLKSKRVVFLLDTCYSAGIAKKKIIVPQPAKSTTKTGARGATSGDFAERQLTREKVEFKNNISQIAGQLFASPGRAVLTSSDVNETSRESRNWGGGHGVFTWALLEGLGGRADANADKMVTTSELFDFVREKVRAETGNEQNPRLFSNLGSSLEIASLKK